MSVLLKSRRLRRKSIVRWTLLVALLAFFVAQVKPIEGVSTPMFVGAITASVLVPLVLAHIVLGFWQGRRRKRRPGSTAISASTEEFDTFNESSQERVASASPTQPIKQIQSSRSRPSDDTVLVQKDNAQPVAAPESGPVDAARTSHSLAADHNRGRAVASTQEAAVANTVASAATSLAPDTSTDSSAHTAVKTTKAASAAEAAQNSTGEYSKPKTEPIDLDDTTTTPEILQLQVERIGDLVRTHDLGSLNPTQDSDGDANNSVLQGQTNLSVTRKNLITGNSYADTADPTQMSQTEVIQLVATLRKDKARLHRLVIAQQAEIDTERETTERTKIMARDAFKSMRDLRKVQKNTEKQVRRERAERKRLEEEYKKVSLALENARSIIASRANGSAGAL